MATLLGESRRRFPSLMTTRSISGLNLTCPNINIRRRDAANMVVKELIWTFCESNYSTLNPNSWPEEISRNTIVKAEPLICGSKKVPVCSDEFCDAACKSSVGKPAGICVVSPLPPN
ncbi:unnamed protein product [Cuscuta campestris]|nr:unnamed protein product [Cuscuta campestris]